LSFTEDEARQAISVLGSNCHSKEAIGKCLEEDGCGDEVEDWVAPIQAGWDILRKWLLSVEKNKIGLLSIG
jgi:hypothetical protein